MDDSGDESRNDFGNQGLNGIVTPGTAMSVPSDLDPLDQNYEDDSVDSPPPEIVYPQPSSSSSSVNLNSLNDVFFESRLAHGDTFLHSLPWEQGFMRDIFGTSSDDVFPVVDLFDPSRLVVNQRTEVETDSPLISSRPIVKRIYEQCVNFNSFRTKRYSESYQTEVLLQKWLGIILHAPNASKTGKMIIGKTREKQLSIVRTVLAGKSVATLRKRSDQVGCSLHGASSIAREHFFHCP